MAQGNKKQNSSKEDNKKGSNQGGGSASPRAATTASHSQLLASIPARRVSAGGNFFAQSLNSSRSRLVCARLTGISDCFLSFIFSM
jgi:hypothetical protein